jgi:drug/metabolite transporter (DMT)-like permease
VSRPVAVAGRPTGRAVGALVLAVAIWGSTYVVIKGALDEIGPLTLALARFVLALPLVLPLAARAGLEPAHLRQSRFWVFGATGVTVYFGLQNLGIALTSAGSAALITAAIPGATAVLAWLVLGERPSGRRWAGIALSTAGVALVVGSGLEVGAWRALAGNALVLASAVAWAAYTVQGRQLGALHPLVSTAAGFVTGAVLLVPLAGAEVALTGWPTITWSTAAAVAFLGVFGSGVAIAAWNTGVRQVEASLAGAFANVVPVIGLGLAVASGEGASALQLLGGALAGAGVIVAQRAPMVPPVARTGSRPPAAGSATGEGAPTAGSVQNPDPV